MQFTGLKDKNGREIYEGDVVRMKTERFGNIYKVMFWRGSFGLEVPQQSHPILFSDWYVDKEDLEVIGNVYENPDLLKEAA
jgi:uncharacterized phage protein (TIGR01671 family)